MLYRLAPLIHPPALPAHSSEFLACKKVFDKVQIALLSFFLTLFFIFASCQTLLQAKADYEVKSKDGWTPLMLAGINLNWSTVALLVRYGASLDEWDPEGHALVHRAAASGDLAAVQFLLKLGADADLPNAEEKIPADIAQALGFTAVAAALRAATMSLRADPPLELPYGLGTAGLTLDQPDRPQFYEEGIEDVFQLLPSNFNLDESLISPLGSRHVPAEPTTTDLSLGLGFNALGPTSDSGLWLPPMGSFGTTSATSAAMTSAVSLSNSWTSGAGAFGLPLTSSSAAGMPPMPSLPSLPNGHLPPLPPLSALGSSSHGTLPELTALVGTSLGLADDAAAQSASFQELCQMMQLNLAEFSRQLALSGLDDEPARDATNGQTLLHVAARVSLSGKPLLMTVKVYWIRVSRRRCLMLSSINREYSWLFPS